jgi:hypothetical protein
MITRRHEVAGCESLAVYSEDEAYRFALTRRWGAGQGLLFIMLNPSTATELANDPTVERCEQRARAWGYPGFSVANIFAFRATRPADLKRSAEPVGAGNDAVLADLARRAGQVICAWGLHGAHQGRGAAVEERLRDEGVALWHLGLTKGGHPRHPLYLGYDRQAEPWARGG